MISQGAIDEPNVAAGTITDRAASHGSRCRSCRAWPTSWAITAAAATDRRGGPPPGTDGGDGLAHPQRLGAGVVVVGQRARGGLDLDGGQILPVEQPAGEVVRARG